MWKDHSAILPLGTIPFYGVYTEQILPLYVALRTSITTAEVGPDTAFPLR